jgi:hypothetical protein
MEHRPVLSDIEGDGGQIGLQHIRGKPVHAFARKAMGRRVASSAVRVMGSIVSLA